MKEIHGSVASHLPSTGDLADNPGMYPDWESNQLCIGSQAGVQSTVPHHPGLVNIFKTQFSFYL